MHAAPATGAACQRGPPRQGTPGGSGCLLGNVLSLLCLLAGLAVAPPWSQCFQGAVPLPLTTGNRFPPRWRCGQRRRQRWLDPVVMPFVELGSGPALQFGLKMPHPTEGRVLGAFRGTLLQNEGNSCLRPLLPWRGILHRNSGWLCSGPDCAHISAPACSCPNEDYEAQ
jgi:hypothetical protein